MKKQYDIFISYRRDGGEHTAMAIRDRLAAMGYRVFLDVEALRSGAFNEALYEVIEHCTDMLVILSPHALDRCVSEDDWVRLEVEHGLARGKNVIPIMTRGFEFPQTLPESLEPLRYQNGLPANVNFFDAFLDKLKEFLVAKPVHTERKRLTAWVAAALVVIILAAAVIPGMIDYPFWRSQKNLVSEVVAYSMQNLSYANQAVDSYQKSLDLCAEYVNTDDVSRREVTDQILASVDIISESRENLMPAGETLSRNLDHAPFAKGDVLALPGALKVVMDGMLTNLTFLEAHYLDEPLILTENKKKGLEIYQEMAELVPDYLYYNLNEMLLPVTNEEALKELKTDMLPNLTAIYLGQPWSRDEAELDGLMEQHFRKEERLIQEHAIQIGEEQKVLDELQIRYDNLREKQAELELMREELEERKQALAELKAEAYEKFRPLETDDSELLWGKGLRFIKINMPEAAVESFGMYARKGGETERLCGQTAVRFVQEMGSTGVTGGCMVMGYEEGLPRQAVEVGDIIYALDGTPTPDIQQFLDLRVQDMEQTASVLRMTPGGYELLEIPLTPDCGRIALNGLNETNN